MPTESPEIPPAWSAGVSCPPQSRQATRAQGRSSCLRLRALRSTTHDSVGMMRGAVWCGAVWCDAVWCGAVWCGAVWCDAVWCGVTWCSVVCDDRCGGDLGGSILGRIFSSSKSEAVFTRSDHRQNTVSTTTPSNPYIHGERAGVDRGRDQGRAICLHGKKLERP